MWARKSFCSFILLTLLVFKVSAAHVYVHQEDNGQAEDCELCEHAVQNQNAEFSFVTPTTVPANTTNLVVVLPVKSLETPFVSNTSLYRLFTRPPPAI